MAAPVKNVLLLGGAGNLGPAVIAALSSAGIYKISVLTRTTSKSTFPAHINVLKSDFSPSSIASCVASQDAVVDLIPPPFTNADRKVIIDASVAAGVKRFIPSEFSNNMLNEKNVTLIPMFKERVEIRDYLKSKAEANKGFSYTVVSNGPFLDWALKNSFMGLDLKSQTALLFGDGKTPFATSTLSTVGKAVSSILSPPNFEKTSNQAIFIASFITTQNSLLAALEKATSSKWAVTHTTTEEATKQAYEKFGKGEIMGAIGDLLRVSTYGREFENDFGGEGKLWNEKLGLEKEDLETVTKRIVDGLDV